MPQSGSLVSSDNHHPTAHLIKQLDVIIWEADPFSFNFTYVSEQAERVMGYPCERWYEPNFFAETLHPDDRDWAIDYCVNATIELRNHEFQYRMFNADGHVVWLHDRVTVVHENGVPVKLCGILMDITAQKRTESELRDARTQLKSALQLTGIGSFTYDLETSKLSSSAQCDAIFGGLLGPSFDLERFLAQVRSSDRAALAQYAQAAMAGEIETIQYEFGFTVPDDCQRLINTVVCVRRDAAGNVVQLTGTVQDVTDRKNYEAEREGSHRYLEVMNRVNREALSSNDFDQMLANVFDALLEIFDCDRVWIARPSDVTPDIWNLVVERNRPEFPGLGSGSQFSLSASRALQKFVQSDKPLRLDPLLQAETSIEVRERFKIRTQIGVSVPVRMSTHFVLGLHHCRRDHEWTTNEERMLQAISRRLADAIASLMTYRSLQESERMLAEAQRLTHLGYWHRDYVTDRFTVSPEVIRILGESGPGEIGPLSDCEAAFSERIHIDDRSRVVEAASNTLANDKTYDIEYRIVRPSGDIRHVHSRGELIRDLAGKPLKWFGTIQDITELRSVERELRESEQRFRLYLDNIDVSIMLLSEDRRILDANQFACTSLGYSREELIGQMPTLFDEGACAGLSKEFSRFEAGETIPFESSYRRKDGTAFPVEVRVSAVSHEDGLHAVSIALDITERKRSQSQLAQSHKLLRAIVEGTSDAIYVKDLEDRYLMINSAGAALFGLHVDDVMNKFDSDLPATDAARVLMQMNSDTQPLREPQLCEETIIVNGEARTFLSTRYGYFDSQGLALGRIGLSRDVTEFKRLSDALRQSQKMEAIGRLAGGIAHDFNNLLTVINSYSELLLYKLDDSDAKRKQVNEIHKCGIRAANLTRQLLAFSRKQTLQTQAVDLNACFSDLRSLLGPIIGEDIELQMSVAEDVGKVKTDLNQFQQAITNLAVNARDAMPDGGRLSIEAMNFDYPNPSLPAFEHPNLKPGRYALIIVSDNGVGVPDELRGRIFEPFFTTKPLGKGTGLGLAMVYGFVAQSGGHIELVSQFNEGSTFRLFLPCNDAAEMASESSAVSSTSSFVKGHETILLVEDEETVRSLCRQILESCGYKLFEAADGQEALEILQSKPDAIDLLVTDVIMPRMNGPKLLKAIRRQSPDLRVLFMSGYADEVVLRDIPDMKLNLLRKPFSPKDLADRVRSTLNTKAT